LSGPAESSAMSELDRRRFHRFPVGGTVRLYSGNAMWTTTLLDLSLRGVLVVRPEQWAGLCGSRFRLDLRLEGGLVIGMGVELMRIIDSQLAFGCTRIDLDSFTRLKRFVELNLGNTEILNRELSVLLAG
jgi:hypothetical protein